MHGFLGIDTSNYTSSLAYTDLDNNLVFDKRINLKVKTGSRGLRQSEAVFQHLRNFPVLFNYFSDKIDGKNIIAIGVSTKPRPVEASYMPVFTVGLNFAQVLAKSLKIPLIETTHQEGHIMAGIWSSKLDPTKERFMALHISGGTTELIDVILNKNNKFSYNLKIIGGTSDISAGQFVDRIGVKLGLSFPAGPSLEQIARNSKVPLDIPSTVNNLEVSFSGPETCAQRLIDKGYDWADVARSVEICLFKTLANLIINGYKVTGLKDCLMVGGVAGNRFLRESLAVALNGKINLYFAEPSHSSDNAIGVSLITQKNMLITEEEEDV